MNKLDMLIEEKNDLVKAELCIQEAIKYLNPMRDLDFYKVIDGQRRLLEKQIETLDVEIEKTKESFNALVVTQKDDGSILIAKTKEGKDVFLRIAFLSERVKKGNFNNAFVFDWVDKIEDECFITYESYGVTIDDFKTVYKYHKKHNDLEGQIEKNSLRLREVEREVKHNYLFKESK